MGYVREVSFQAGDRVRAGQLLVEHRRPRPGHASVRQAEAAAPRGRRGAAGSGQRHRRRQGQPRTGPGDLQAHGGPVREEVHLQPGVRRGLGAAESRHRPATRWPPPSASSSRPRSARPTEASTPPASCAEYAQHHGAVRRRGDREARRAGQPGRARRAAATIEREGAYRLEAPVEESRLARRSAPARAVTVTLDALDRTLEARVSEIVPAVDAASRSYIVKIDLPAVAAAALRHVRPRASSRWARARCWRCPPPR